MTTEDVIAKLDGVTKNSKRWMARCPAQGGEKQNADTDRFDAGLDTESIAPYSLTDEHTGMSDGDGGSVSDGCVFSAFDADALTLSLPPTIDAASWISCEPPQADPVFEDLFDLGDKVCIIAGPKMRKSFFTQQMAFHLAAGQDFLDWDNRRFFTVLLVQAEIKPDHYHGRVKRMHQALGNPDIGHRLHILNGRGYTALTVEAVEVVAKILGAQIIIFDPLYKFTTGDENSAQDMKPVLASFDQLALNTGAAVVYVHHDPKGDASERNIRDRGAGSGVLARDYDAAITLTAHRDNPDTAVIHTLLRNHPPRPAFCATWMDGRFEHDHGAAAVTGKGGKYDATFIDYIRQHPDASLGDISTAIGCDKSTASRLRKKLGGLHE